MEEKNSTADKKGRQTISLAIVGGAIIAVLLTLSTLWINQRTQSDTKTTVHSVSEIYLRELTDRREQVIQAWLRRTVDKINSAPQLLVATDLQNIENLSAFLGKVKLANNVDQIAFVNANGTIFTPDGVVDAEKYSFAKENIIEPKIFTGEEIDRLDPAAFACMSRPELHALKRKLSDSFDWLESGNWDLGDPRWKEWENRLDRLNELMAFVDEFLYAAEARYDVI